VTELHLDIRARPDAIEVGAIGVRLGIWEPRPDLALRHLH
jgi:hypothetical protein